MESIRKLTPQEEKLLELLVSNSTVKIKADWKEGLNVQQMVDGQAGSLYLYPKGIKEGNREFGQTISEFSYADADRIDVIVSLNVDTAGELLELDIWKTNFDTLISYPVE